MKYIPDVKARSKQGRRKSKHRHAGRISKGCYISITVQIGKLLGAEMYGVFV